MFGIKFFLTMENHHGIEKLTFGLPMFVGIFNCSGKAVALLVS
jgi:hypothetical protein